MIDMATVAVIAVPSAITGAFCALALRKCCWRTLANEWRGRAHYWRDECYKAEARNRSTTKGPAA